MIDHNGRVYSTGINPNLNVNVSMQDGGKTMKCFVHGGNAKYRDPYLEIDQRNRLISELHEWCMRFGADNFVGWEKVQRMHEEIYGFVRG